MEILNTIISGVVVVLVGGGVSWQARGRFDRVDERFDRVDERFNEHGLRLASIEAKLASHDARLDSLDGRVDRIERGIDGMRGQLTDIALALSTRPQTGSG